MGGRVRLDNFHGIGNLPVLAELQVPCAPYVRPKGENSVGEHGLLVPLDRELPEAAREWHQDGQDVMGTNIQRASMFDLHRTQTKHLRVTSHLGQLYEGINDMWTEVADTTVPGGRKSLRFNPDNGTAQHRFFRHMDAVMIGLGKVVEDNRKLSVALYVMTTTAYRDGLMLNSLDLDKHAELADILRFTDSFGQKLALSPEHMADYYKQDCPRDPELTRRQRKYYHEIRRRIEAEMGDDFAGRTGPNAGQRTADDAYYMGTTGVTIPAATEHLGESITPSRKLRRKIVNAAAVAIYERFHFERRRLRQRIIRKRIAEGIEPAPEDREYLTQKKAALTTPQKMEQFTAVKEKHRADDRHSERMPPVVSPPAARTPAAATATAASPGSSSDLPEVSQKTYNKLKRMLQNDPDLKRRVMAAAETPDNDAASSSTTGASTSRKSSKSKSKRKRVSEKATYISTDEELFRDPHAPLEKKKKRKKSLPMYISDDSGEEKPKEDKTAATKDQPGANAGGDDDIVPPSQ